MNEIGGEREKKCGRCHKYAEFVVCLTNNNKKANDHFVRALSACFVELNSVKN